MAARVSRSDATLVSTAPPREPRPRGAYFNRELSWLAFNRRVLAQAQSTRHPLLERVNFLAIVSSNLDEFFEIRVAGLIQQMESGVLEMSIDGLGPREQLRRIHAVAAALMDDHFRCWQEQLRPALAREGIRFRTAGTLSPEEAAWVDAYFHQQVYPVLTPLALDQAHAFPQIGNKTLNIIVALDPPGQPDSGFRAAILPVPRVLPRLVRIASAGAPSPRYIFLHEIIKRGAGKLFPGCRLKNAHVFRVTRNSDLYIDEEEAENLLKKIEEELRNLRRGAAVRLEFEAGMDEAVLAALCDGLRLPRENLFRLHEPLDSSNLASLVDLERPDLKYAPFTPVNVSPLRTPERIFEVLRRQDVLLHHPYDAFAPVVDFVTQAARDPQVLAIKQTLYRTSGDSPVVQALIEASRHGKQVTALIELKARFDEANNIQWARQLAEAGVNVAYGLIGHKTHCKLCLVLRREGRRIRAYAHLGTGNYNPRTARLYTDLSLFTTRPALTRDIARLFNALTGLGRSPRFTPLLVAPYGLHDRIGALIVREAAHARAGRPARIIAKINALVDKATIDRLYVASQAGVQIDLIVRGICCLVPGVPGLSENIRVRSVVGRFLEHARVYFFLNDGGAPVILAGSADWMPRNFFRRVEVLFPIDDPSARQWIVDELFVTELRDNVNAWLLQPNGAYVPAARKKGTRASSSHQHFMRSATRRATAARKSESAAPSRS